MCVLLSGIDLRPFTAPIESSVYEATVSHAFPLQFVCFGRNRKEMFSGMWGFPVGFRAVQFFFVHLTIKARRWFAWLLIPHLIPYLLIPRFRGNKSVAVVVENAAAKLLKI